MSAYLEPLAFVHAIASTKNSHKREFINVSATTRVQPWVEPHTHTHTQHTHSTHTAPLLVGRHIKMTSATIERSTEQRARTRRFLQIGMDPRTLPTRSYPWLFSRRGRPWPTRPPKPGQQSRSPSCEQSQEIRSELLEVRLRHVFHPRALEIGRSPEQASTTHGNKQASEAATACQRQQRRQLQRPGGCENEATESYHHNEDEIGCHGNGNGSGETARVI